MALISIVLSMALIAIVKCQENQPIAAGIAADRCFEPVSTGNCRARFPSFHYNPLTETCDCFIFGGCRANGNKFATLDDCMNTCGVNPQLQTISSTCVNIFGTDHPELTMTSRNIESRPVVFSLETSPPRTSRQEVIVKASSSSVSPTTEAPSTASTSTDSSTTAASSIPISTTATPSTTVLPTTTSTTTTSAPIKPTSTPGPWDHWLNL